MYVAGHQWVNRRCTRLPWCIRLRNDLYCVKWGVKLYSLTHSYSSVELLTYSLSFCCSGGNIELVVWVVKYNDAACRTLVLMLLLFIRYKFWEEGIVWPAATAGRRLQGYSRESGGYDGPGRDWDSDRRGSVLVLSGGIDTLIAHLHCVSKKCPPPFKFWITCRQMNQFY